VEYGILNSEAGLVRLALRQGVLSVISVCPTIVIAGANSGVGKTSVTLALVAELRRRGLKVQTYKVGPDYLDPTYLAIASGRPCYNLDGWMMGKDYVTKLFVRTTTGADIAVIEGVMGLFDGADPDGLSGSTAEVAMWLDAPVILIVNVHGVARSLAPIVKGFAEFVPELRVEGVVANQCGSERHGKWLAKALEASKLPILIGAIPRGAFPELPSRHLGLVTADDRLLGSEKLSALADAVSAHISLDIVLEKARRMQTLSSEDAEYKTAKADGSVKVGLAYDRAFHFYYADNLEALEAYGGKLVKFSPLDDSSLPEGLDGIYLGGGYPEEHAHDLSRNESMLESIRSFAATGKPVYGECGGLMYLCEGIETRDRERHKLVGLIPAWTRMLDRLKSLGYVETTLTCDSLFGKEGVRLRGHEFHYSELLNDPTIAGEWRTAYHARHRLAESGVSEGFQKGMILASYVHTHFASQPEAVKHFVDTCRRASWTREH
jgi:cobyrinic acid a,c-diamide synthase